MAGVVMDSDKPNIQDLYDHERKKTEQLTRKLATAEFNLCVEQNKAEVACVKANNEVNKWRGYANEQREIIRDLRSERREWREWIRTRPTIASLVGTILNRIKKGESVEEIQEQWLWILKDSREVDAPEARPTFKIF